MPKLAQTTAIYPLLSLRRLERLLMVDRDLIKSTADKAASYYDSFDIYKGKRKDGTEKWRHIDNPTSDLRNLQDAIYSKLLKPIAPKLPPYLSGGMPGRSILDNALPHLGKAAVVTLDIEGCFPNIKHKRIFAVWRNDLGCSEDIASMLTQLTTLQTRLPQGAPTSPMLCNLALQPLAEEIQAYALSKDLTYTQYVDDITISGNKNSVRQAVTDLIPIVRRHGYNLGNDKINIMDSNEIQKTTGLKINKSITITKEKISAIRSEIMRIESLGNNVKTYELNRVWGQIYFLKSINPTRGTVMQTLAKKKLANLIGTYEPKPADKTRKCKDFSNKH